MRARKVDIRLSGKGNSNSHGARQDHKIISMIKWIRTSRMSIKNERGTRHPCSSWPISQRVPLRLHFGCRVSGSGFRHFLFRVSGFGFRVSGFGFRVPGFDTFCFGFRVSGFGFRVSGFGLRVSGFMFQRFLFRASSFGFRASGFDTSSFRVPGATAAASWMTVWGLGLRVQRPPRRLWIQGIRISGLTDSGLVGRNGEVSRGEKMLYSGIDPESYITEFSSVYEEKALL